MFSAAVSKNEMAMRKLEWILLLKDVLPKATPRISIKAEIALVNALLVALDLALIEP
jgi:hypothetical protein